MTTPVGSVWAWPSGDSQPSNFADTVSGVQAALDLCEAAGGGEVMVDSGAGIEVTTTSVKIPNRITLRGTGCLSSQYTFIATAATSVSAMVENKTQDGTQHFVAIENISISGSKGLGATVAVGLKIASGGYITSRIRDVFVTACSGYGIRLTGATDGPNDLLMENIWVTSCNDHNIYIDGKVSSVTMHHIASESPAAAKAAIKIDLNGAASINGESRLSGIFMEGTNASDGLVLNQCANIQGDNIVYDGSNFNNVIKITGSGSGSDGAFGASGHTFRNVRGNITTIIDDQTAGVTVGNAQSRFVAFYSSPSAASGSVNHQTIGLQAQMQGQNVASVAAMTLGNGNFFVITGTADITSITAAARDKGRIVVLQFSGTAATNGLVDGSNLVLAGNLAYTPNDTITLICDGTNWIEMCRSVN